MCGVPCWIYTSRDGGVGFQVNLLHFISIDDNCASFELAYVELHVVGFVVAVVMTVDALSVDIFTLQHVVVDDLLIEVFDVASIN